MTGRRRVGERLPGVSVGRPGLEEAEQGGARGAVGRFWIPMAGTVTCIYTRSSFSGRLSGDPKTRLGLR